MKRNFTKLNKKMRFEAVLSALAFGAGLGLLTAAGAVAIQKLGGEVPQILCTALPAGAVFLIAAALFLLISRPTEKRNARTLDARLALGEKVQTMVEFAGQSGDILEIQREDTKRILEEAPGKHLRNKRGWLHAILPLVAVLLLTGSILMPVLAEEQPPEPPTVETELWSLTDWHIAAVRELIKNVRASDMDADGKETIARELEALLVRLEPVTTKEAMKEAVFSSMVKIDGTVDDINTFTALVTALEKAGSAKVGEFAKALGTPSDPIIESKYAALKTAFLTENIAADLFSFSQAIHTAVDSTGVKKEDPLYKALKDFASAAGNFKPQEAPPPVEDEEEPADPNLAALTALFEGAAEELSAALDGQNKNRTVSDNAINTLMTIFGIPYAELPEELRVRDDKEAGTEGGDYDDRDEDEILNPGGLGGGEILYGSDDAIYYPEDDEYVRYGEVIDEYNGKKTEILEDGGLSDSLKDFIDRYFADLYNKNKD